MTATISPPSDSRTYLTFPPLTTNKTTVYSDRER
ncbi:hypothetical protein T06_7095 [Trichinella sp. T6]|nr:hypothetical protein T06_7095 [Trichinella sp. T6]